MMKISDLPRDLLEEILSRVPATSYKQLRSTCKLWRRLFTDERFIKNHFDKAPKQFRALMLKDYKVCSTNVNLHGTPSSIEFTSELNLNDPLSSLKQLGIFNVSHCDGLLLCTIIIGGRLVVWNPCTSQTRWIQPRESNGSTENIYYALGSYKDNKHQGNSYKILSYFSLYNKEVAIFEMNSNSWRTLDVKFDCHLVYSSNVVSLKGNTYWFGSDEKEESNQLGMFLLSFDYTTERFGRLPLPCKCPYYNAVSLSVVREEKLAMLLQRTCTTKTEIWVTNKIGNETENVVSWNIVLTLDLINVFSNWAEVSYLVDEEKKVIACCDTYMGAHVLVHIVGKDNKVRRVDFGEAESSLAALFNYVPSLIQIHQGEPKEKT